MFYVMPSKSIRIKTTVSLSVVFTCLLSIGCQSLDYRQMAYSALRHDDCLRNEVTIYCSRSDFQHEYNQYERLRKEFLLGANNVATAAEQQVTRDPNNALNSNNTAEPDLIWATTPEDSPKL